MLIITQFFFKLIDCLFKFTSCMFHRINCLLTFNQLLFILRIILLQFIYLNFLIVRFIKYMLSQLHKMIKNVNQLIIICYFLFLVFLFKRLYEIMFVFLQLWSGVFWFSFIFVLQLEQFWRKHLCISSFLFLIHADRNI